MAYRIHNEACAIQFSDYVPHDRWAPPINAYQSADLIEVCIELAGVQVDSIELVVDHRRLVIRGLRKPPEPPIQSPAGGVQILAMEIAYGPFERELVFSEPIAVDRIAREQVNGLLWVYLHLSDKEVS